LFVSRTNINGGSGGGGGGGGGGSSSILVHLYCVSARIPLDYNLQYSCNLYNLVLSPIVLLKMVKEGKYCRI
jgi:hypothetical protein